MESRSQIFEKGVNRLENGKQQHEKLGVIVSLTVGQQPLESCV